MANPTAKTSIPKYANLKAALWITDQIDQSGSSVKGAWDALTGTYYAGFNPSNLTGVALGTSGQDGLSVTSGTVTGIALEASDNATGGIYEPPGPVTVVALVRSKSASYSGIAWALQNKGGFSPNDGFGLGLYFTGPAVFYGSGNGVAATGLLSVDEVMAIAFTYDRTTTKLYKNGTSVGTPYTGLSTDIPYATSSRRAAAFNYAQSANKNAEALEIYAVLVWHDTLTAAEIQSFGTTQAALLAGDFHSAAFSFGSTLGGNVALADVATAGGLVSVSSSLTGSVTLDDTAPAGTLGAAPGRIRLLGVDDEWRNKVGALLASKTCTVDVDNPATGALLARITTATDAAGLIPEISNGALGQSTLYRLDVLFATGEYGVVYRTSEAT